MCIFWKIFHKRPPLLCPPPLVAQRQGPLLPKLRGHFAEFLQHRSLKRLGMLYQSTCVGFGYGLAIKGRWGCFLEPLRRQSNPIRSNNFRDPSHISRPTNINVVPIDYPLRARLRGRLTLRGLALRRNPWSFGDRASHPVYRYSCQHSHFRYLHGRLPFRFAGVRNAPLPLEPEGPNPKLRHVS